MICLVGDAAEAVCSHLYWSQVQTKLICLLSSTQGVKMPRVELRSEHAHQLANRLDEVRQRRSPTAYHCMHVQTPTFYVFTYFEHLGS